MINTIFAAPRLHSGVQTGLRRVKERVRLITSNGEEKQIFLPMSEHPVMLTMAQLMAPGILSGRATDDSGIGTLWTTAFNFDPGALSAAERLDGVSETFDALRFCHVLAKVAHSYMLAELGPGNAEPFLTELIRANLADDDEGLSAYRHVGGSPFIEPASRDLHEIGLAFVPHEYLIYVAVRIRLFSNLGTPTYYVIPGHLINLSLFRTYRPQP
jgi:hypothetical protein